MKAINTKMLRDLRNMRGMVIAIGFVIIAGISVYVTMASVSDTLQHTLENYYEEYNFAQGFASVKRAPQSLVHRLRKVAGVNQVDTRVSTLVNVMLPDYNKPVNALIVSIPGGHQPLLNQLYIKKGRLVKAGQSREVVVSRAFANAHHLTLGDHLTVIIKGNRQTLTIVGIALSPEFLYQVPPGGLFPNPEKFGILWMNRKALAAATNMEGAFNRLSFTLAPNAEIKDVIDRMDQLLQRYGGQGAFPRADQTSHDLISDEFKQLQTMAFLLPIIFLGVAAFLLNIVVSRLIALQREQIAILKAFGYSNVAVALHYLKLVFVVALTSAAIGTLLGMWLGQSLAQVYLAVYHFPYLKYTLNGSVIFTAFLFTAGASLTGALLAVRRALKLPPAEAMRPAAPPTYRSTMVERLGLKKWFDQPTRIIFRNLERQWLKSALTVVGIACSCAILIMGLFWGDSFDKIIHVQFDITQRQDMTVTFIRPTDISALYSIDNIPGVQYAEPFRSVSVRLHHGPNSYDTSIRGMPVDPYLSRVVGKSLQPVGVPPKGIVLSQQLADILEVQPGDMVTVEVQKGRRYTRKVPVVKLVKQYFGLGAYMSLEALNRLAGQGNTISGVYLMVDAKYRNQLARTLQHRPQVASITSQKQIVNSFIDTAAKSLLIMAFILSIFAGVIALGVIYNSVRISLSERSRELASMRVLGFTKGEIAYILLGEMAILVLCSIPLGMIFGVLLGKLSAQSLQTELYRFPFVLHGSTLGLAATIVLVSAIISALLAYRKLTNLDLIEVLKTRE